MNINPSLVLFNLESCPECRLVREKLAELQLTYVCVNVNPVKSERRQLYEVTGQYSVPALIDGDKVLTSKDNILEYLVETYGNHTVKPMKY
jgi:glutathione S-transferase